MINTFPDLRRAQGRRQGGRTQADEAHDDTDIDSGVERDRS